MIRSLSIFSFLIAFELINLSAQESLGLRKGTEAANERISLVLSHEHDFIGASVKGFPSLLILPYLPDWEFIAGDTFVLSANSILADASYRADRLNISNPINARSVLLERMADSLTRGWRILPSFPNDNTAYAILPFDSTAKELKPDTATDREIDLAELSGLNAQSIIARRVVAVIEVSPTNLLLIDAHTSSSDLKLLQFFKAVYFRLLQDRN